MTSYTLPINSPENLVGEGPANTQPASAPQETQNTRHLPQVLGLRDLTVLMVLTVVFVNNTNGVQFAGPSAFFYWMLGLLTFLVPSALFTQWLARRFPGQGAPYLWVTHILGPRWSFFAAFCAWLPGVLSVVAAVEASIVFVQYLAPTWFTTPGQQCLATMLILCVVTGVNCLPLRWVKRILLLLVALYLCVFVLLGAAGIWWLKSGHHAAVSLNSFSSWQPNGNNFAVYGLVILALLGADIPIFMGGEIRGGHAGIKRASQYVWWGTAISFVAYMMGTFGIMVIVPPNSAGVMAANVQAISVVFGTFTGNVTAVVLALSQVSIVIAYILMFSRLLVVVAQDRRLPASLTKINRYGVPVQSIIVQAALVAIVTILSFVAIPSIFMQIISPTDLAFEIYNLLQAGTTVVWVFSIIQLFVLVPWFLYRRKRHVSASTRERVLLLGMSFIGTAASCIGIWSTVSSSWLPTLIPDERWTALVIGITVISLVAGWIGSELPHAHALLSEQRKLNDRETTLRAQLQEAYDEQQELLAEVDRLYREQAKAAVTDAITGLPNHRAVMSRIDEELSRCQRAEGSCAILFVDLDHFKRVNDTWGHRAGDAILREVGARLRSNLRMEDFVGRYGGEEFAIVLTNADLVGASQAAERLLAAVNAYPCSWQAEDTASPVPIEVTASIGVAVYSLHGVTREALIEAADRGMYRAKHTGRNRVCIADVEVEAGVETTISEAGTTPQDNATMEIVGVQALAAAASAHDRVTGDHARRMIQLAEATARKLNRPESELHLIRLGALLHDIGKIGIPEAILHKPGPLTDEEWTIMRRHPEIGCQILEQIGGVFHHLARIVVAHHERWDGRGYPAGLAEDDIPMTARILAVVDSYDAMTSRRPYREPMSVAEAKVELQRCAGSQYDPTVVAAFLAVLDEQEAAYSSHESISTASQDQLILSRET